MPALEVNIADEQRCFLGTDIELEFQIGDDEATAATIAANTATMVDVSGWALEFVVRTSDTKIGDALLSKTTAAGITIAGTFNASPTTNTQRVTVTIADTDIPAWDGSAGWKPKTYRYSLKRTDAGSEKVLAFGDFVLQEATAR